MIYFIGRNRCSKVPATPVIVPEPLSYDEAQKMVQFDVNGQVLRVNINDTLEIISKDKYIGEEADEVRAVDMPADPTPAVQLPEANFKELENYSICDAPPRPNAYIRFIEKSAEELDGEVC